MVEWKRVIMVLWKDHSCAFKLNPNGKPLKNFKSLSPYGAKLFSENCANTMFVDATIVLAGDISSHHGHGIDCAG